MRRAICCWFALTACVAACVFPAVSSGKGPKDTINGIGLIDFGGKPTFKVGDWARYHISGHSEKGESEEYDVTLMIGGEEQWWGEDCFWIETWAEADTTYSQSVASLMSYEIFSDTSAFANMQLYVRKLINSLDEDGNPDQVVFKRASSGLKTRALPNRGFLVKIDTLGTESVTVPKGTFECRKVRFTEGRGATGAFGDSTDYTELREVRTTSMSRQIPITHIVREVTEQAFTRRAWKVGYSKDAKPTVTLNSSTTSAQLVSFGSGLEARMVPKRLRKSIALQRAEIAKPRATPKPTAKRAG